MTIATRIKCRNPIWTRDFTLTAIGFAIVVVAFLYVQSDDYAQQERAEAHRLEAIAVAKVAAHEKAVAMRNAGLFEQSNALMMPCCQAHEAASK